MRLHFKEDPREWRKAALLSLIGPSVLVGILRWRAVVSWTFLGAALALFALVALCAWVRPRWFRRYLTTVFFLILTPLGWMLRLSGKDLLQLKSPRDKKTFWQSARQDGSLDRMY
jgi:hypothetical protein